METLTVPPDAPRSLPRFGLSTEDALIFATRLVSQAHRRIIVDAAHGRGIRPDREPTLLFELHRALTTDGILWWSTPAERVGEIVQRALRLGFAVPRIGVWVGPATTANIIALQRSSGDVARAVSWPLVVAVPPEGSRADGWRTVISAAGHGGEDAWITEVAAPDATVGAWSMAMGLNWLGHGGARRARGVLASGDGEAALVAAGGRVARFLPELLGPPRPTTQPGDLFATASRHGAVDAPVTAPPGLRLVGDHADNDALAAAEGGNGSGSAVPLGKASLARVAMPDLESPHRRTATGGVAR